MEILSFIGAHWVEWLFAIISGILAAGYRSIAKRMTEEKERNEAIAEGVQALLRENIVSNYNRYLDKGYCPIYAKESTKRVYKAYSALGGNDVATSLYKKLLEMPEEPEKEKGDRDHES